MKKFRPVEPGESQLEKILEAGIEEFADRGLDGARIEAISKRAGVAPSLLYYYFDDKEELYSAVLESALKSFIMGLGERLKEQGDFMSSFGPGMLSAFEMMRERPVLSRLLLRECLDGAKYLEILKARHPEWVGSNFRLMVERLKEAMAAGVARQVDADRTVAIFASGLFLILGALPVLKLMAPSVDQSDDPMVWFGVLVDIVANTLKP
ncbi:MAG: TetR/AcrR family transcriptional regulator [Deltaproteobacteria bacterium]|nr:TetR/AcrR family transcriptional regulator [Deltaproteobacteria bacterium]